MNAYRQLPSVNALIAAVQHQQSPAERDTLPHHLLVAAARAALDLARNRIGAAVQHDAHAPTLDELVAAVLSRLQAMTTPSLRPVINATGVIIQTNLGRAPLSDAALAAMHAVGAGYSNLEYDLTEGRRGSRTTHPTTLLCQLTGAEAALLVNNNAAAVYLALTALATGREVIISRGQAVEIGGGFRIPDVLRQSGATLVEVGTTNRTYPRDYAAAIGEQTALLLRVHTSNFRLVGFVHETPLHELCTLGQAHNVPVLDDLGSGTLLPTTPYGLAHEPTVQESISAGADLVTFSGDKLLGGPQGGIIVGRRALVERLKRHPLARALRVDKTTIAAMEATLRSYLHGSATEELPVWGMIAAPLPALRQRAEALAARLAAAGVAAVVVESESAVGGGALPGETLPSVAVALLPEQGDAAQMSTAALASALRSGSPAVVPRISDERLLLDMRTVLPPQDEALAERVIACCHHAIF